MRDDGDDPCCGDGVERLQKISQLPTQFEIMSLILWSRSGATYEVAGEVEDVGGHGEGMMCWIFGLSDCHERRGYASYLYFELAHDVESLELLPFLDHL